MFRFLYEDKIPPTSNRAIVLSMTGPQEESAPAVLNSFRYKCMPMVMYSIRKFKFMHACSLTSSSTVVEAVVPTKMFFQGESKRFTSQQLQEEKSQEEKQQPAPTAPTLLESIHIPSQTFKPPNKNPKTNLTNFWDVFVGLFLLKNPPQVRNLVGRGRLHSCSCCSCSGIRWQSSTPTHRLVAQVSFIHLWYVFLGGTGWGLLQHIGVCKYFKCRLVKVYIPHM